LNTRVKRALTTVLLYPILAPVYSPTVSSGNHEAG
jgi:hypothetical protein